MRRTATAAALAACTALLLTPQATAADDKEPVPDYEPTVASLNSHPTPQWFEDDKFGIFIHWGAYSVPAWGPRGSYAEWYWNYMNARGSATHTHHRQTYGADAGYDDFIGQWKAEKYDPDDWVKLFKDAGAKYFVLTSKHHEGVALYDSKVSGRDTVGLGPRRDLAGELFAAARKDRPGEQLKAGFYYSLYEWYNPSYTGRPATNPYTGAPVPYTGAPAVGDYVGDYMAPQMRELIDQYDPDIIWCDGQWEKPASYWKTAPVLADYYNQAKNRPEPKEVAVANRCKIETGALDSRELDFQTPEYTVKADIDPDKWEASRGIAHSYGYNQNEPEEDHLTSDQLVDSLADIVSKNGNLLLDIGPRADGTIPDIQRQRLLDIGAWLKTNGEAIYGTTYWHHAEEPSGDDDIRYTAKDGALYATALKWPGEELTLGSDTPVTADSGITLLGSDAGPLPWKRDAQGRVVVSTPARAGEHAYVFKVTTPGVNNLVRTRTELPRELNPGRAADGDLTVTNTARRSAPSTRLRLSAPEGWTVTPSSARIGPLGPGADAKVPFTLTPPASAEPGTYALDITLRYGLLTTTTKVKVTVARENLAQGRPATQKSTAWDAPASRAVDGDTDGAFGSGSVTHTAEPSNQAWWQVDLGTSARVDQVQVWNRTDCCADRLKDFWVLASANPITADGLDAARSAPGVTAVHVTSQAGRPTTVTLPPGTDARYVRVQLASPTSPLSLAEVQVRGSRP
ncbi:alpha-L-fucosidase [Streptomyces sp. V4I23]|uniref:alpha-L-fucosidase n=1 Tax=Streptomyces sp. V4I23 TaxID=3042282 RepID=UPI00278602A6|nr:alpha-L-fucosidase [Streptomyces sp. V4I23]MDQ1011230.1 alpha-L-fucosidase [Streptomyces sp. V4I23]